MTSCDTHGREHKFKKGDKLADNYIFLGDIAFGFFGLVGFCHKLDKSIPDGVEVYFIRGNHDDPSFWTGRKKSRVQEICPRFHMVQDYDVIIIDNKKFLCIGGGISIDRNYRVEGKSYWPNEAILPCPCKNTLGDIYGILSHTGFTPPVLTHKHYFQNKFPDVDKDCQDEQRVLFDVLNLYQPKVWFNGHYHVHVKFKVKDCLVTALDINEHFIVSQEEQHS